MNAVDVVGWTGTALLVTAYAIVSMRKREPSLTYQLLNSAGAAGLIVNGAFHGAWPSVGLNVIWLAIAVVAIFGHLRRRMRRSEHDESR